MNYERRRRESTGLLKVTANFMIFIGWIVIIGSIIAGVIFLESALSPNGETFTILVVLTSMGVLAGIFMIAQGQFIKCFIRIERNTWVSARVLQESTEEGEE